MSGKWVVHDLICHKWFQGVCHYSGRCWNQHGNTFDEASAEPFVHNRLYDEIGPPFLRFHRGRYPSTSQPERCRNDDYEYFGVVSPQYDQELALRHELHPVVRPRFLDDDERRGGQRAASPVGRGRGVSPPRASSRALSIQAAAWSDRRPRTPTRTPLPPARSATPPPTRYFASSAPRFGAPRSSFRQGDVGDRVVPTRVPRERRRRPHRLLSRSTRLRHRSLLRLLLRHQPTMMMFGINGGHEVRQAWDAKGQGEDPWVSEWINNDIPENSRPATPPPSRPSSSEVVPVHVEPSFCSFPCESALDKVINLCNYTGVPFGPPPRVGQHDYMPQYSWTQHLEWALHRNTNRAPKDLDPTLRWCLAYRRLFHPLPRFQQDVISEIKDLGHRL